MNHRMVYLPFGILAILLLAAVLSATVALLFFGLLTTAFAKMGFSWSDALLLLAASLLGAGINLPLFTVESKVPVVREAFVKSFGLLYRMPVVRSVKNETTVAVNVGGALIPIFVSAYLLISYPSVAAIALAGTAAVALVTFSVARPIGGLGIATPLFIPPLAAALSAILLTAAFCPIYPNAVSSQPTSGGSWEPSSGPTSSTSIGSPTSGRRWRASGAPGPSTGYS